MKYLIVTIFTLFASLTSAAPFNIDTNKSYNVPPKVDKFFYWFGDVTYGAIFYTGTEDVSGFETELHLNFHNKKISSALLILGPAGLDGDNCMKQYKSVLAMLNQKYGHYQYIKDIKDPIIDDLVPFNQCDSFRLDARVLITTWKVKNTIIKAKLVGDEDGFYIEIDYIFRNINKSKKLLKFL